MAFTYLDAYYQSCQIKYKLQEYRKSILFLTVVQANNSTGKLEGSSLKVHNFTKVT